MIGRQIDNQSASENELRLPSGRWSHMSYNTLGAGNNVIDNKSMLLMCRPVLGNQFDHSFCRDIRDLLQCTHSVHTVCAAAQR